MFGLIPYTANLSRRGFTTPFTNEFFRSFFETPAPSAFKVDVLDRGDHYSLEAELPGVRKEDVQISVENGVLTISANTGTENEQQTDNYIYRERRYGSMQRAFSLEGIREDGISAEYKDGVLRLNLPKEIEPAPAKRLIDIA